MAKYHTGLKYHNDTTEKHEITQEEKLFLRRLQMELNTQDNVSQADPRLWVIKGSERIYRCDDADGFILYDSDTCETVATTTKEICDYINEELLEDINSGRENISEITVKYKDSCFGDVIEVSYFDEDMDEIVDVLETLEEINEWLESEGYYNYEVISYKIVPKIYEDTMFLTQIDAENHLKTNYYHYSEDAHTYAMTAWRSPRVEKLIEILRKVEW